MIPAALQVLHRAAPDIVVRQAPGGWDYFEQHGTPLPDETLSLARECRAVLFGAVSSPSWPVENYYSPVVRLRRELQAYANLRPTRYLPVPTARKGVDLVIVRENTEDLYVGQESTQDEGQTGVTQKIITRGASERVARLAFELASSTGRKRVTIVHKSNVMPRSDGLFRQVALEISEYYTSIETDELLVDTAAYWMVKEPMRFDVVLAPNLYGDILSGHGGGLGRRPRHGALHQPRRGRGHRRAGARHGAGHRRARHRQPDGQHPQRGAAAAPSLGAGGGRASRGKRRA